MLAEAFAQVPAPHRRHPLIRRFGAHVVLGWLTAGRQAQPTRRVLDRLVDRRGGTRHHQRAADRGLVADAGRRGGIRDGAQAAELAGYCP
ncbi:hypothetical protein ACIBXQ_31045 [Micromonospora globbae]|uniref:hypothetical protein n=1 Tax=Micromonospora globbae TaxID=1894969 RepID=UPI0037B414D9